MNGQNSSVSLQDFGDSLWIVEGPRVRDMGLWFTTRMTVVKLNDGSLWIDSPIPIPGDTMQQITGLGPIKYLIAATPRHVWRLEKWHSQFPEAELWVTPQIRNRLKLMMVLPKRKLRFNGILDDSPPEVWAEDFDQTVFKGSHLLKEVFFLHKKSRTLILDDIIQNHPLIKGRTLENTFIKIGGVGYPYGGVALDIRLSFTNRGRARQSLERVLSWDFDKLVIAHGPCVDRNAKAFVEKAFRWLKKTH